MRSSSLPSPSSPQPLSSAVTRRAFAARALMAAVGGASLLRATASAQQAVDPNAPKPLADNVSLKDLMTPEQYRAAGLKKLSPEELASLERFLKGYRDETVQTVTQTVTKQAEERVAPSGKRNQAADRGVIESRIKGDFDGLKGRTRMVLENGSIWQQGDSQLKVTAHLTNPEVVLVRSIFGYRMFVVGLAKPFYVKQVVL